MSLTNENKVPLDNFLRGVPIFASLSEKHFKHIAQNVRVKHFEKSKVIFHQSDASNDLYIVLSGKIRASLFNEDGNELVLAVFEKGSFFGEMGLIDGADRSATLIANEDSAAGVLERTRFLEIIKQDVPIAIELLVILADRLRTADTMAGSLAFLDVHERLVKLLSELAKKNGTKDKNGFYRIGKISQSALAATVGSSRTTVAKALKALAFKKILTETEEHFLIKPSL